MPDTTKRYEVIVDSWGAGEVYHKGDIVTEADIADGYDLKWAVSVGILRSVGEDEPKPSEQTRPEPPAPSHRSGRA